MSEPIAEGVPPLPSVASTAPAADRLDVDVTAEHAIDLDAQPADPPVDAAAPAGRHRSEAPEPRTRAERRTQAQPDGAVAAASAIDHPAVLVGLSVLTLVALVIGIDQATQGTWIALLPAVALVAAYVVVVRRRRSRR